MRHRFAGLADGAPDDAGGVLLIVPFDVPAGEDERFLAAWEEVREVFSARRGYLGAQLLAAPDAQVRRRRALVEPAHVRTDRAPGGGSDRGAAVPG